MSNHQNAIELVKALSGQATVPLSKERIYKIVGIYFLYQDDDIVYVGQSQNIGQRVYTHLAKDEKVFNYYAVYECPKLSQQEMDNLEARIILEFDPRYNGSIPPNSKYKTISQLKKILRATAWGIKRWIKEYNIQRIGLDHYRLEDFKGMNDENRD